MPLDLNAVVQRVTEQVAPDDGRVACLAGNDEPAFLVCHPGVGLVAVDLNDDPFVVGDQAPLTALNVKVHGLRQTLKLDAGVPIGRVVLFSQADLKRWSA